MNGEKKKGGRLLVGDSKEEGEKKEENKEGKKECEKEGE